MKRKQVTNCERLEVLMKPCLTNADIQKLVGCGYHTAAKYITKFNELHSQRFGYEPFKVSTVLFVKWFRIDKQHIAYMAEIEKKNGTA